MSSSQVPSARPRTTISKGRFVSAGECATKLYYKCHPEKYFDSGNESDFMKALAEGGFQVGELAKLYYPGAIDHSELKPEDSWRKLQEQIAGATPGERLVFFEATIISGRLLARADILEYQDGTFWLHEVKSKSARKIDPAAEVADPAEGVMTIQVDKKTKLPWIRSEWKPYILDATFQAFVLERAFSKGGVTPTVFVDLIVANKNARATRDGINQLFRLVLDPKTGRTSARTKPGTTSEQIGASLLMSMDLSVGRAHLLEHEKFTGGRNFQAYIEWLEELISRDEKAQPTLTSECQSCEFRQKHEGLKSGFEECWTEVTGLSAQELEQERLILEIWNWPSNQRDECLSQGVYLIRDLDPELVISKAEKNRIEKGEGTKPGGRLSDSARRYDQVLRVQKNLTDAFLNASGLRGEIDSLVWPLHLIDFESARVAIPFHRGQGPYGQIAFQFSHHLMHADGRIEHESQFLEASPGVFPNFLFVRALRRALGDSGGSVFMFHHHEKTVLNDIYRQLETSEEADRQELQSWIRSLARPSGQKEDEGEKPSRELVDLRKWVLHWWHHPATRGSNSIKAILPVVFAEGGRFEAIYSQPIYGAKGGVRSLNFKDKQWIHRDPITRQVKDPYKTLDPIFAPDDPFGAVENPDRLFFFDEINQGGAAMQAYARMQFTEMRTEERQAMQRALLRYCELDTFAMGILIEYFKERVGY